MLTLASRVFGALIGASFLVGVFCYIIRLAHL